MKDALIAKQTKSESNASLAPMSTKDSSSLEFSEDKTKKKEPVMQQKPKKKGMPNYMVYQGKTKHCCGGRWIYGSNPKWPVFSCIFFNIPPILYYCTIAPVSTSLN